MCKGYTAHVPTALHREYTDNILYIPVLSTRGRRLKKINTVVLTTAVDFVIRLH